ncbi:hypothetical protein PHYBLDRAFT_150334 [Phycomyces blakesleeanus NRRL 1555(-)]|uniref:Uncharacterized protein n=1 Tax=Phycomyces blakesleeanus (strain ATCC 8743b / DSM 1359 / FGSC 10004 / NBRC 33097 / NRRL 1555) TaxID=763407 RepID=A0A162TPE2_PHYB8|nr:hypothetical protein PHYBLDRAFT_150334 [Phycomyces blakesleeanus NRRL 1555(-)]OAD68743.1 hypothetical protein PHYBLDRAFT_150334 [Phycomyces blakesleeanus NRRL 1555(-)]|eukprot:XP_018286783.1 hypothetical protein PHYBLDRAFT_150334 [Phycomyces blakesleeanus NRRL 1555(-)]
MSTSLVPPVMAHCQTKPPKEPTVQSRMVKWYNLRLPREGPGFDSRSAHFTFLGCPNSCQPIGIYKQPVMVDFLSICRS